MIKQGDTIELTIDDLTLEGQGVGRADGLACFVDGVIPGETVRVRIETVKKTYATAVAVEVLSPSAERIEPFCPAFGRCGGCQLQHMNYEAQLKWKTRGVEEVLKRIGGLEDPRVLPCIGMETPFRYRNKAQFPVGGSVKSPVVGFYERRSHRIVDTKSCGIQDEAGDKVRAVVRDFCKATDVRAYDEKTHKGLLRHVVTRTAFSTGEVMVILAINGGKFPGAEQLIPLLKEAVPGLASVYLNVNMERTNVVLSEDCRLIWGRKTITEELEGLKFELSPLSFFQVNPVQTQVLYGKALALAGLTGVETVLDLYSGTGTISLFLARKAGRVIGVEVVEPAVEDARKNAERNGVKNVTFYAGQAEVVIPELYEKEGIRADVVVVDPPRKGCDERLLETIVEMAPARVVYVSCNPATLARDVKYLTGKGFSVNEVQPVDMFGWTGHVEAIILMTKCGSDTKK